MKRILQIHEPLRCVRVQKLDFVFESLRVVKGLATVADTCAMSRRFFHRTGPKNLNTSVEFCDQIHSTKTHP